MVSDMVNLSCAWHLLTSTAESDMILFFIRLSYHLLYKYVNYTFFFMKIHIHFCYILLILGLLTGFDVSIKTTDVQFFLPSAFIKKQASCFFVRVYSKIPCIFSRFGIIFSSSRPTEPQLRGAQPWRKKNPRTAHPKICETRKKIPRNYLLACVSLHFFVCTVLIQIFMAFT